MLQFRQDALKQDKSLKVNRSPTERLFGILIIYWLLQALCKILLVQNGFSVPNGEVEVKDEPESEPTESESSAIENQIHPSIQQLCTKYPELKLSKSLGQQNMAPVVSIAANEVKKYFKERSLNMNSFIYKPVQKQGSDANKEGTEARRTVSPIKISRNEKEKYKCTPMLKRKLSTSGSEPGPSKVSKVASEEESKNSSNNFESNDLKQITTVKSKTLLECHVCRTFYSTSFALKMHLSKHRVCQFCKITFKSIATKDLHLKDLCEVKRILTSQPFVRLEPIHLNPSIRSKYSQSFEGFPSLPSKDTSDVVNVMVDLLNRDTENEQRNLSVAIPSSSVAISQSSVTNSQSSVAISQSSVEISQSLVEVSPCSVSIVRPDIDIKNSALPYNMTGINDEQFLKQVIRWAKEKANARRTFTEKMVQTNLPLNLNINTNPASGGCVFKGLKDQLLVFKIPINITKGPYHIQYKYCNPNKNNKTKKNSDLDSLPVAYSRKIRIVMCRDNNKEKVSVLAQTIPTTRPPTLLNSQVSKAIQPSIATLPKPTPQINLSSATPLLQSYVSSIPQPTPVLGFQDFERKFLNTALQNRNGKQVVTTVSKARPNAPSQKPPNNAINKKKINGASQFRVAPTPPPNRTVTTSAVIPNRVPASFSGNTTITSEMQMVRSMAPNRMTFNTRLVPVLYNTGRDQAKTPNPGVNVNNQSSNVLYQNSTISITREASKPNQYPVVKKTALHVVAKSNASEVAPTVGNQSGQQTVVSSVAPTKGNKKDVTSVSYSHQCSSDNSIQSKPVFRVKSIRELQ